MALKGEVYSSVSFGNLLIFLIAFIGVSTFHETPDPGGNAHAILLVSKPGVICTEPETNGI